MCFILRLAPCFVATAGAVLVSALACIRNDSPISFRIACAKINSADSAPRAYISDSPLDKATVRFLFQCRYRQVEIQFTCPFKYLNALLARVKSASVGDASLYDKQNILSRT